MAQAAAKEQPTCWCFFEPSQDSAALRYARYFAMAVRFCQQPEHELPSSVAGPTLLAATAVLFDGFSVELKQQLANLVAQGASLYVRGLPPQPRLDLQPFAEFRLTLSPPLPRSGYRLSNSPLLPAPLRGEAAAFAAEIRSAEAMPDNAESLLELNDSKAVILILRYGRGLVIIDLLPETVDCAQTPLLERLADPSSRPYEVGALTAVGGLMYCGKPQASCFNVIVDDRPVNFDLLNVPRLAALLHHVQDLCPGAHIDFGWTPCHTHPWRSYVQTIKSFPAGFVWHGLNRHIDHKAIADPWNEFAKGRALVSRIEARFGVRLQPIMVLPFERSAPGLFAALARMGFLACVEQPGKFGFDLISPRYLKSSTAFAPSPWSDLPILFRYPAAALTSDRMLAMAALNLPIIALAHPEDLGLRRLSRLWLRREISSYLDRVLNFAAAKKLAPCSLEEIVRMLIPDSAGAQAGQPQG